MDYEICFLVCGNRASALGLQKAVGCFLCEESELFCFCGRAHARARACRSHGDTRAGRAGHTLGFVSALLSQISSHITKAIKARKVGGFFMVLRKNCHSFNSYIQAFFIRSYGDICGLPSGRAPKRRTDTWRSGSGSASHCGGIPLPDKTAWECIFRSRRPWWSPASGVGVGGPPLCWYPCNSSRISDNGSDCLTSGHHRRQVLKRAKYKVSLFRKPIYVLTSGQLIWQLGRRGEWSQLDFGVL